MNYCRHCGREISYKRTKNDKWMPYDIITGEPHFCDVESSGINICNICGRPIFMCNKKIIDYTTLCPHVCQKGNITRFKKYQAKRNTNKETFK